MKFIGLSILFHVGLALDWGRYVERDSLPGCYHVADIALVIDSSRSIRTDDFVIGKNFIANFAGKFTIGPDNVRFATITFSDGIHEEDAIRFPEYTNAGALKKALKSIPHREGDYTGTGDGIKYMREELMKEARDGVQRFGIVITDGQSQEGDKTANEAAKARAAGIKMVAIGVGQYNITELKNIASGPNFIFQAESYSDLREITSRLLEVTCEVLTTPVPAIKACGVRIPTDVYFMYEQRHSKFGYEAVQMISKFVRNIVQLQNFGGMNFGTITICDSNEFDLGAWEFPDVAGNFDENSGTQATKLLYKLNNYGFTSGRGYRDGAKKVAVLFLNDKILSTQTARLEAEKARGSGIELYVVDLGGAGRSARALTSGKFILRGTSIRDMSNILLDRLCEGIPHTFT